MYVLLSWYMSFLVYFYQAYWQDGYNLEETENLQSILDHNNMKGLNAQEMSTNHINSEQLKLNTEEASNRGAFGVPR